MKGADVTDKMREAARETGREGVGFKVDPAWVARLEALADRRIS